MEAHSSGSFVLFERASIGLGLLLLVCLVLLSVRKPFNHDEFEALKSAWKIARGELIYVDFFQHHHPFLYYLLAPLFLLMEEGPGILMAARMVVLPFSIGILLLAGDLARRAYGHSQGLVAMLLLLATPLFVTPGIEIRPDVPQVFFALLGVALFYRYLEHRTSSLLIAAGFSFGLSFLFLQKTILFFAAFSIVVVMRLVRREVTWKEIGVLSLSSAAFPILYAGYWLLQGNHEAYLFFAFTFNSRGSRNDPLQLRILWNHARSFNLIVILCFLSGLFTTARSPIRRELAFLSISILGLTLLHGVHFHQYYLLAIAFVATVASYGFILLFRTPRTVGLIALLLVFADPVSGYIRLIGSGNSEQIERVEYVRTTASPDEYVYDGNIEFNLFRKDLDFFWFSVKTGLEKYRSFRPYRYEISELIAQYRPVIISEYGLDMVNQSWLDQYYAPSDRFEDLYVRKER